MDFKDLVRERRSHRAFDTAPVSEEQIRAVIEAGCWAPSPLNLQPWEFIVITDPEQKSQIGATAREAVQRVIDGDGPGWVKKYGLDFLTEAPVLVVVLDDASKGGLGFFFDQKLGALQAASACIQNMMLAAADMGFGSLWFTFFSPERLRPILGIPDHLEIAGLIPIGKPMGPAKAPPRKEPKIYWERHG